MYSSVDPTRDPAYIPFTERPPDTRAVRAAFANEVGTLMDELARAADRTRHKVIIVCSGQRPPNFIHLSSST